MTRISQTIVCTAMAVLVVFGSLGPARSQPTWELGLKAGVNAVKLTGDDTADFSVDVDGDTVSGDLDNTRASFAGGGYAEAHVSQAFGVRLEALYSRKGGKGDLSGTVDVPGVGPVEFNGDLTMNLDYVEIPLLAVVTVPLGSRASFEAVAGPAVGFNVKAEIEASVSALGQSVSQSEKLDEVIKGTDFGGVVGAGVNLPSGTVEFLLDARWTFGLTSIDDTSDELDLKNSAFSFCAGLGFPLTGGQ